MKTEVLYQHLEDLLERVGISIVYDDLCDGQGRAASGLCRVKGRRVYIMDRAKDLPERISLLKQCLSEVDLDEVYVLPALREFLEEEGDPWKDR